MTLTAKLSAIQEEFKTKKSRYNSFGKYNYRSAEDILEALKPINAKYGVYFTISESMVDGWGGSSIPIIESTATISDGNEQISAKAIVGVDLVQKGMQVPQAFGSASSYAKKYALGNLLLIDDTADADAVNTHDKTDSAISKLSINSTSHKQYTKAAEYISGGGKLETIKSKYILTAEVEEELKKLIK
jgi:hypothetical protein